MNFKANLILVAIDSILSNQVNKILHHPEFQKLEASWRGLSYLLKRNGETERIKVKLLDISWDEIGSDLLTAIDFDQSQLFKKVYTDEFDQPGGTPYGLLICDYLVDPRSQKGKKDVHILSALAGVAAASFSPCIIGVTYKFLGIDCPRHLEKVLDIDSILAQPEYEAWRKLRQLPDTRFMSFVFSRVCLRLPYRPFFPRSPGFCFEEKCHEVSDYLWGSSVYCLGDVIMRSFQQTGWFLKITGTYKDSLQGGIVEGLPTHYYPEDSCKYYSKPLIEIALKEWQEQSLVSQGFIVLSLCRYSIYVLFPACPTIYQVFPKKNRPQEKESIGLDTTLCISRFAHYLKIMGREKVGLFITAEALQDYLQSWILNYTAHSSGELTDEFLRKYPLKEASINMEEHPARKGYYFCHLALMPHQYRAQIEGRLALTLRFSS